MNKAAVIAAMALGVLAISSIVSNYFQYQQITMYSQQLQLLSEANQSNDQATLPVPDQQDPNQDNSLGGDHI
jgi:hypothetical protein